jgi:hypothetical protein
MTPKTSLLTLFGHRLCDLLHDNSGLHHDLDRFALVHGAIAVRDVIEPDHSIEDAARLAGPQADPLQT